MNAYQTKLNALKRYGFYIQDDNSTVVLTTDEAQKVHEELFTVPKAYILGNVPTENENLKNVEYDILFQVVEKFAPQRRYQELHEVAMKNDIGLFLNHLQTVESGEIYDEMEAEIVDWIREIHRELDEILVALHDASQKNGEIKRLTEEELKKIMFMPLDK